MNDNVLKFQRPEKAPEPPQKKPRGPLPSGALFVIMIAVAIAIYLAQQAGLFG